MKKIKILTEASGSAVSSYMLHAIRKTGNVAVGSDINDACAGKFIADEFIVFPKKEDGDLWIKIEEILTLRKIDIVIPSFDEMLLEWSKRKLMFEDLGVSVLISPPETIEIFQDKWETALFFENNDFPCAQTSRSPIYPLVKPRFGRGSSGVFIEHDENLRISKFSHDDISQTILSGVEFTVDCLFNANGDPIYIIPRKRLGVVNGKSTGGITVKNKLIEREIKRLARATHFVGPINIQCFVDGTNLSFVEVNPRVAGGMALGMAATENWVPYFIDICTKTGGVKNPPNHEPAWGMKMFRTYQEYFSL